MCGIVIKMGPGDPSKHEDSRLSRVLKMEKALNSIRHRGLPGRRGVATPGNVVMGHVRLPIRGLSPVYDQPFHTPDYVGVFVGEVFGIDKTNDALYALELISNEGPKSLATHDGFWSIAFLNHWSGNLTVLTDHLGIKPLYWNRRDGVIASEIRAVEVLSSPMTVDFHYLSNVRKWGYDPTGRTQYQEIVRMDPGTVYKFNQFGDLIYKEKYFELKPQKLSIRSEVETAVKNRLVSDIPVAALCSGGLDSTIVSLLAAQHSKKEMTVFHIDNNEQEYFNQIQWPSNVKTVTLGLDPVELEKALEATEEPVDLGSVLPQYQLGKAVSAAGFKVVLSGDGADELFGGYKRSSEYDSQYSDIFSELVHYHNPRLDKCMMASTVELRSPFLAPRVIQAALALPYGSRTHKQVLKAAFSDIVPKAILDRDKVPLKTKQVIHGGVGYREAVIQAFLRRNKQTF